jgi:hypothetical protein
MMKKSNIKRFLGFGLSIAGLLAIGGSTENVFGQQDPFAKPAVKTIKPKIPVITVVKDPNAVKPVIKKPEKALPPPIVPEKAPSIEERIAFYKKLRETAAMNGQMLPKPTTVMTLDELAVNGIFHNSKGFSAIVEATPIKLSYTVYPGEKFFDGQLVAIEENRLVFRRITKMSNGKTIASEDNKALRIYSAQEQFQGTAPVEQTAGTQPQPPAAQQVAITPADKKPASTAIVSPLEQWEKQGSEPKTDAAKEANTKNTKGDKSLPKKKNVKLSETSTPKKAAETSTPKKVAVLKSKPVKKPAIAQTAN